MTRKHAEIDLANLTNRSILIIDDNLSMHRDYRAVLRPAPNDEEEAELARLEAFLLGNPEDTEEAPRVRNFQLQSAYQGEEAYELVKKHHAKRIRYPLAFVDMRMPPGWDGLETILRLREVDPEINFVIVTAYSDYAEEEIEERLGKSAKVEIYQKPFDPGEIYLSAYQRVSDWNAARGTEN